MSSFLSLMINHEREDAFEFLHFKKYTILIFHLKTYINHESYDIYTYIYIYIQRRNLVKIYLIKYNQVEEEKKNVE